MEHVLDNPAWNALLTGNKNLAKGNEACKYFDAEISPFAGLRQIDNEHLLMLHDILPAGSVKLLAITYEMEIPKPWAFLNDMKGHQMVYEGTSFPDFDPTLLRPLTEVHVPQMLSLTKLTNPGPFAVRTIEFGHYMGVFNGQQLVAMAGQRMHAEPYAEISAVCTHPDYLGKGYARLLLQFQINRILAASGVPYLHVRHDNYRAIEVYESIGFKKRTQVHFHVLRKA